MKEVNLESFIKIFKKNGIKTLEEKEKGINVLGRHFLNLSYQTFEGSEKFMQASLLFASEIDTTYDIEKSFHIFQLYYEFPFCPNKESLTDTLLTIAHYNATSPLPGFSYLKDKKTLCYRCALTIPVKTALDENLAMGFFRMATTIIEGCEPFILEVATGQISYRELQEREEEETAYEIACSFIPMDLSKIA